MEVALALIFGIFLAYANGANDNFKGVSTLFGSHTTNYRKALIWACSATFLGSVAALALASELIAIFGGKGLVPDAIATSTEFSLAVGLSAATTVMLATHLGFPISTTHALTGALVGSGLIASTSGVNFSLLASKFFLPLLLSPLLAIVGTALIYPIFSKFRRRMGVKKETCLCVGTQTLAVVPQGSTPSQALAFAANEGISLDVNDEAICQEKYAGRLWGLNIRRAIDEMHFLSAGAVSFARGLNDTPKLAAILLVSGAIAPRFALLLIGIFMLTGGWLNARRIAETMSHRVTEMNAGQGFTANLITSCLVIFASKMGVPVSTTHVSCGALFGIGAVTQQAHWKMIGQILLSWLITLPLAGALAAIFFLALRNFL